MAKKDVEQYYNLVCKQHVDMTNAIKELSKEVETGMAPPELLDTLKKTAQPLMQNYQRISYIMFLLNEPKRTKKKAKYKKQLERKIKALPKEDSLESTLRENTETINNIKNIKL